jgi:hypothetical protein
MLFHTQLSIEEIKIKMGPKPIGKSGRRCGIGRLCRCSALLSRHLLLGCFSQLVCGLRKERHHLNKLGR